MILGVFFKQCIFCAAVVIMQCSYPVFMLIESLEVGRAEKTGSQFFLIKSVKAA